MTVTVPSVSSVVTFNPGALASGGGAAPNPAGVGGTPIINLAMSGTGAVTGTYPALPGGGTIVPAIVMAAGGNGGLIARLLVQLIDGSQVLVNNVPHVSTNPAGPCWEWGAQSVFPGVNA